MATKMKDDATKKDDVKLRQAREESWHDVHFKSDDDEPAHYSLKPGAIVYARLLELAGDLREKDVLEYGCGIGWSSAELASRGARLVSFDISASALERAREFVDRHGYSDRTKFMKMPGEQLQLPDSSVDICFGNAVLHHLELPTAMSEMFRVLRPGGRGIFAEPLQTNPLINIYRRLTPQHRTPDETPLDLSEFRALLGQRFDLWHEEYFLTATIPLGLAHVPMLRVLAPWLMNPLLRLDRVILKTFPFLGDFAWYSVLVMTKRT